MSMSPTSVHMKQDYILYSKSYKTNRFLRVDINTYNTLREMGFTEFSAKESLRQANNDMNTALQVIKMC